MSERTPPVTMKVVAERVGVSIATVSNAFSRPDQLSAQLRADILTAADALGYAGPNATGRALRSGRTDVCGILYEGELANTFLDPYSVLFLAGLSESVEAAGASVLLMKWLPDDDSRGALRRAAIDALVAPSASAAGADLDPLRRRGVRVVGTQQAPTGDWVGVDNVESGRLVGRHLAHLGHRDVAVIAPTGTGEIADVGYRPDAPTAGVLATSYQADRLRGLWQTLPGGSLRVVTCATNTREAGRDAAARVLDVRERPTAVVALSDVLALGVTDACQVRGLALGHEVSVTGFDDIPDAAFTGLTTVRQPIREKGRLAGLLAMNPDHQPRQITLPIELVVRSSTGPAGRPADHQHRTETE